MKLTFEMTARRMRIVLMLVCYAAAVLLALHMAVGIEFWRAVLWTLVAVIVSMVLGITTLLSL